MAFVADVELLAAAAGPDAATAPVESGLFSLPPDATEAVAATVPLPVEGVEVGLPICW